MTRNLIITRHAGAVEWLRRRGIVGEVVAHATPDQVRGRICCGVVPLNLAALASEVWAIDMPGLKPADRGRDLTPEEMDEAGAELFPYVVLPTGRADLIRRLNTHADGEGMGGYGNLATILDRLVRDHEDWKAGAI